MANKEEPLKAFIVKFPDGAKDVMYADYIRVHHGVLTFYERHPTKATMDDIVKVIAPGNWAFCSEEEAE